MQVVWDSNQEFIQLSVISPHISSLHLSLYVARASEGGGDAREGSEEALTQKVSVSSP